MANDPKRRPSLLGWRKGTATPFSDVVNVSIRGGKEVFRPWQGMVEVSGEKYETASREEIQA